MSFSTRTSFAFIVAIFSILVLALFKTRAAHFKFFTELESIAVPRISNTEGNLKVQQKIISHFTDWYFFQDRFIDNTPEGPTEFTNLYFTRNPHNKEKIILSAHFDSLNLPSANGIEYIGAIDSAVPCTMLMELASKLDGDQIDFVFFDGEEAVRKWTKQDSLYGSRHLAEIFRRKEKIDFIKKGETIQIEASLSDIKLVVVLDLLGSPNPKFYNDYDSPLFDHFVMAENELRREARIKSSQKYFYPGRSGWLVSDDHEPFSALNVSSMLIIPIPFPDVWHTLDDDLEHLDHGTIKDLRLILERFAKSL